MTESQGVENVTSKKTRGWKRARLESPGRWIFLCWVPIFLLFKGTLAAPPRNRFVDLKVKASLYVRNSLIVSSKPPPIHGAPPEQLSKGQGPLVGPGGVVGDEIRAPIICRLDSKAILNRFYNHRVLTLHIISAHIANISFTCCNVINHTVEHL